MSDDLEPDPAHPIPDIEMCDVHGVRKDKGHDLVLVIASPISGDLRSQRRLIAKLERYLQFLAHLRLEEGQTSPLDQALNEITVKIHASSDPVIFDLIERSKSWVAANRAILQVSILLVDPDSGRLNA